MAENIEEGRPGIDIDTGACRIQYAAVGVYAQALRFEMNKAAVSM